MLSYQVLKDRYKQLQNKYKASQKEWRNEINEKDKNINKLKATNKSLNEEITHLLKKLKEKDIIIGNLLQKNKK